MPDASETWNQQPVNLATMNGMFYVGPFTDLSLCQAYRTNGVTGMFDNLAYNTIPIIVSITELRCEATSSLP